MKQEIKFRRVIRNLLKLAEAQEQKLSVNELDVLWKNVEERVSETKRKARLRIFFIASVSSAAAVMFCVFMLRAFFVEQIPTDATLLTEFAMNSQIDNENDEVIRLIMSGEDEINVEESSASIQYSQNGTVTINADTISKSHNLEGKKKLNQLIIPKGKRSQLTLADGTHMWINSGTRIIYPECFDVDHREIYVEGEIYLDVFHNEASPFTVVTKDFQVQVLGTSFNVSAYPTESTSSVVLVQGSVNVKNQAKEHVKMLPGQLVDIKTGKIESPKNVDVEPYVCWVQNMLMYSNEPLDNVFKKLSLYYGIEIKLKEGVADLKVSGKLDLKEHLEDVLHTISYSAPVEFETIDGVFYISKTK